MHHHHHHHSSCNASEAGFAPRGRRRGFGGLGRALGQVGSAGGGFPFGRFVGDGELRLIVLALLAEGPRHGYDLIRAMEDRSSGCYSPSPGVIYPTLTFLEEAGHASSAAEGNKKVFAITEAGQAYLAERREEADAILARIAWVGKRLSQARQWFERGQGDEPGRDRDIPDVLPELNEARRAVKEALLSKLGASAPEQRRVAELLRRAADEILGSNAKDPDIDI